MTGRVARWAALVAAIVAVAEPARAAPLRVGSKRFTESYILAEIAVQTARATGSPDAVHLEGLGATAIAFKALEEGAIDLYPDYTGTLVETIFDGEKGGAPGALEAALDARGLALIGPLGFDNTYALAVRGERARAGDPAAISDLSRRDDLVVAVSHEFLGRSDGWPGLVARYGLQPRELRAMDHGLAYAALAAGEVDVTDAYSTDAKIAKYGLRLLADDRHFFPTYAACFLYRKDARVRFPAPFDALDRLRGTIDEGAMRAMNGEAELDGKTFADVARDFLARSGPHTSSAPAPSPSRGRTRPFLGRLVGAIVRYGPRHLELVAIALGFATLIGVALGILASRSRVLGAVILGAAGVVQTVPSLALLCLCIPLFGVGVVPALVALFVYGLLPIMRNTCVALTDIPAPLRESAQALGLTQFEALRLVELPLASRTILAGIKTSAVLTVGTATVAAFIGAGGFGEPISVGLNLNDTATMLEGAIPAALFALLIQPLFALVERAVVPRGLRIAAPRSP